MAMKSHAKLNYFMDFMLSGHGWHSPVSPELSKQRARDYVVRGHLKLHSEFESSWRYMNPVSQNKQTKSASGCSQTHNSLSQFSTASIGGTGQA